MQFYQSGSAKYAHIFTSPSSLESSAEYSERGYFVCSDDFFSYVENFRGVRDFA